LNYLRLVDDGFSILENQGWRKNKNVLKPSQGLTLLKPFAASEPLNILRLKTRDLNLEGDNNAYI